MNQVDQNNLSYFLDRRAIRIFLLGIASGFPWVLIGSMLTLWLKDSGISRTDIGYAGAIFAVYSINFLWSPLVDRVKLPLLSKLGQRRSWIFLAQLVIAFGCIAVAFTDPATQSKLTILYCLIIASASATQDIAIDAYRIDSIDVDETELLSAGAAMTTAGWWTGYAGLGAIALWLSDFDQFGWPDVYLLMSCIMVVLLAMTLTAPEPESMQRDNAHAELEKSLLASASQTLTTRKLLILLLLTSPIVIGIWGFSGGAGINETFKASAFYLPGLFSLSFIMMVCGALQLNTISNAYSTPATYSNHNVNTLDRVVAWLALSIGQPFREFFVRNGLSLALKLLLFILVFKIGEAFLGRMSLLFYKEVGFSNTEIAFYSKLISFGVTVAFSIIGGWFTIRYGLVKGLVIAGLAMAASNLMFVVMALAGPVKWIFAITVVVDGFTTAWSSVAFVAFISSLCHRSFTATQYALLASLGTFGRTFLASSSGQLVDYLNGNWAVFFALTAAMVIPSLLILRLIARDIENPQEHSVKIE